MIPHLLPARRAAGTTLVELVVALLVLGVAATVAAPALPRLPDERERAARSLLSLLGETRLAALRAGRAARLEIDLATGAYRASVAGAGGADSLLASGRLGSPAVTLSTPTGATTALFRFGALGLSQGDTLVVGGGPRALLVVVDPWTGRPHAER